MILIIDNYDSFTYNIVDYMGTLYPGPLKTFRNDKITIDQIKHLAPKAIIISPGPKTPTEAGLTKTIIAQFHTHIPMLGICLGHQAICEIFGGKTIEAKKLMHGKTSQIQHTQTHIFRNIPNPFEAMRYHSLTVDKNSISPKQFKIIGTSSDDNEIMAVAHLHHPLIGLQFHPESILTNQGLHILQNFLNIFDLNPKSL